MSSRLQRAGPGGLSHWKKSEILQQQAFLVRRQKRTRHLPYRPPTAQAEAHCFYATIRFLYKKPPQSKETT